MFLGNKEHRLKFLQGKITSKILTDIDKYIINHKCFSSAADVFDVRVNTDSQQRNKECRNEYFLIIGKTILHLFLFQAFRLIHKISEYHDSICSCIYNIHIILGIGKTFHKIQFLIGYFLKYMTRYGHKR